MRAQVNHHGMNLDQPEQGDRQPLFAFPPVNCSEAWGPTWPRWGPEMGDPAAVGFSVKLWPAQSGLGPHPPVALTLLP